MHAIITNYNEPLLAPKEVMSLLGVSHTTFWRWTKQGLLPNPIILPNGKKRWTQEMLNQILTQKQPDKSI